MSWRKSAIFRAQIASQTGRIDRIEGRLDRIEQRLDLIHA